MSWYWMLSLLVLILTLGTTPAWIPILQKRKLMRDALNPTYIRRRQVKMRAAEAKKEAKRMANEIVEVTENLVRNGQAHTEREYAAKWFLKRGYTVELRPSTSYSRTWDIKIPVVTEKEIADLIVK